jgi:hypothetical protein
MESKPAFSTYISTSVIIYDIDETYVKRRSNDLNVNDFERYLSSCVKLANGVDYLAQNIKEAMICTPVDTIVITIYVVTLEDIW